MIDDRVYDKKATELENEVKSELTDEFLSSLIKVVRTCGWSVDHTETVSFVNWCFDIAGKKRLEIDDLTPLNKP